MYNHHVTRGGAEWADHVTAGSGTHDPTLLKLCAPHLTASQTTRLEEHSFRRPVSLRGYTSVLGKCK